MLNRPTWIAVRVFVLAGFAASALAASQSQTLNGGDELTLVCDGKRLTVSQINTTSILAKCVPSTSLTVATPAINPNGGTFTDSVQVALTTTTPGASIHYTIDGSAPTINSPTYSVPFKLTSSAMVKAQGFLTNATSSKVASAAFTVNPNPVPPSTPPPPTTGGNNSHSMGLWTPNPKYDTCSKEFHDSFFVIGPDGKKYPTWHPPVAVDPATGKECTFGHEHGRDPSGSSLMPFIKQHFAYNGNFAQSGLPFGLANESLDMYNEANAIKDGMRHEDHVGHKIEWENGVILQKTVDGKRVNLPITCDFLMKIHQGTHSPDAFTNNMHELEYFVQCSSGVKFAATKMVIFGKPGQLVAACDKSTAYNPGIAMPMNSPMGDGVRFIPTRECALKYFLVPNGQFTDIGRGLYEDWVSSNYLRKPDGTELAYYDPHFAVFTPSRYYDPSKPNGLARSVDLCFETESNGDRAHDGSCDLATDYGKITSIAYDDPRSPFNGVHREMYFNQTWLRNPGGPTVWYTDPFGNKASTAPFPGSIKQYIAPMNNYNAEILESQAMGANRSYGGKGVHAPN